MQCTTAKKYKTNTLQTFGDYKKLRSVIGFEYFPNFVFERQLEQDLILNMFFKKSVPTCDHPVCTVMMGIPGSGKTTYANRLPGIHIDPDAFKFELPEFHTFPKHLASGVVHKEAAFLAEVALRASENMHIDIVWDAASSNSQWLKSTVTRLKKSGYRVDLVRMMVSYETSYIRCVNRDRHVPKFVIQQMMISTETAFLETAELFDNITTIHT